MASHGWRGDKTQLLGGETQKVLSNSQQPVLIYKKQSTMH
jgi:nucleotide-binding universal stress UspA family protein